MTNFCQHVPMSRLFETQNSRGFIDPTLRSVCGVIEIQPLRGCKKSVFYQTRAIIFVYIECRLAIWVVMECISRMAGAFSNALAR